MDLSGSPPPSPPLTPPSSARPPNLFLRRPSFTPPLNFTSRHVVSTPPADLSGSSFKPHSTQENAITSFYFESKEEYCNFLEEKIDIDIGYYYWKKYIASAFWAQLSMPINLALTFITAITTAQANTAGMLSQEVYSMVSIAALILSVLNTFFRPHLQMTKNGELMKSWSSLGSSFEQVYFSDMNVDKSIEQYKDIMKKVSELRDKEGPDTMNFFTDLLHLITRNCCMRRRQKWLDTNRAIMEQSREQRAKGKSCDGDCCFPGGACNDPRTAGRHVVNPSAFV